MPVTGVYQFWLMVCRAIGVNTSYNFSNVTASHTISANFVPVYTITTTVGPNGTMSPTYISQILSGSSETFHFTPNHGFTSYVSIDGSHCAVA